jgi:hypothetical protein
MNGKKYPQPTTRAEKKEYFVSVRDGTRKLFDIQGPFSTEAVVGDKVVAANRERGIHWNVATAKEGPCYAETVRSSMQSQFQDHTFVWCALSTEPSHVVITTNPLTWS